jgi:hypothetical protein
MLISLELRRQMVLFIYLFLVVVLKDNVTFTRVLTMYHSSIYSFQHSTLSTLPLFVITVSNRHTGICVAEKV